MSAFIAFDPYVHGVLHMRDWTAHIDLDADGKELQILQHQPTKLKFLIATDLDADGKFLCYGVVCQNAPFNRLEQPDLMQVAQHAIRFYCAWKKTTPEAEQRKEEEWANTLRTLVNRKTNGIIKVTDEMREHVYDDCLLIFADDPSDIASLEAESESKRTQAQQIDHFIENTCWGDDLTPEQITTTEDRKSNLRAVMIKGEADPMSQIREARSKAKGDQKKRA